MVDDWGLGVKKKTADEIVSEELEQYRAEKKEVQNIFSIISSAVDRKFVPTEEELNKMTPYIFLRYFSNDPSGLMIVSELNIRNNIPKVWEYWFMRLMMPQSTRYIRYMKKEKFEDETLLNNLKHFYKCNEKQALEYYNMLPPEEIEKIKEKYRHGIIGNSKK